MPEPSFLSTPSECKCKYEIAPLIANRFASGALCAIKEKECSMKSILKKKGRQPYIGEECGLTVRCIRKNFVNTPYKTILAYLKKSGDEECKKKVLGEINRKVFASGRYTGSPEPFRLEEFPRVPEIKGCHGWAVKYLIAGFKSAGKYAEWTKIPASEKDNGAFLSSYLIRNLGWKAVYVTQFWGTPRIDNRERALVESDYWLKKIPNDQYTRDIPLEEVYKIRGNDTSALDNRLKSEKFWFATLRGGPRNAYGYHSFVGSGKTTYHFEYEKCPWQNPLGSEDLNAYLKHAARYMSSLIIVLPP